MSRPVLAGPVWWCPDCQCQTIVEITPHDSLLLYRDIVSCVMCGMFLSAPELPKPLRTKGTS